MFNNVLVWIRADWTHALVALGAVLTALITLWGWFKAAYAKNVGHPLPRNGLTLALDIGAELGLNILGVVNKVLTFRGAAPLFPPTAPPPPAATGAPLVGRPGGSPGRASVGVLLVLALSAPLAVACHPQPGPSNSPTEVSSWTSTARTVLSSLEWIVPAARALLSTIFGGAAEPVVARSLDAVADAASRLNLAVDAYEHRGGDRCAAHAAVGAVGVALVQLAQVLTDHGIALGRPIEHVVDAAGGLADTLTPACSTDAGFGSVGDGYNRTLRTIEASAASRGVFLRRDLDGLRPLEGAR